MKLKMFIGLIYDHTFIKDIDRDFVGDAIITFYPECIKDKVIFCLVDDPSHFKFEIFILWNF